MCMEIDPTVKALNKRIVWKVFDQRGKRTGKIVSLFQSASYPLGKRITRSRGSCISDTGFGTRGLHFYLTKAAAAAEASDWTSTYIAEFKVNPADFMFASTCGKKVMYKSATRVGKYIRVRKST